MNRWLAWLLLAVPITLVAELLHTSPTILFFLAAVALIPLAGLIGTATEVLAERLSPQIGGLLNATFGNAAEIIIGLAALSAGLTEVVRASITGSIIGNALLVLGSALFIGGWRHGTQRFEARNAGQYAALLAMVVIGLAIPSLLHTVGAGATPGTAVLRGASLTTFSIFVAIILLGCYLAYLAYEVFHVHAGIDGPVRLPDAPTTEPPAASTTSPLQPAAPMSPWQRRIAQLQTDWHRTAWLPLVVLGIVTAFTAIMSEILVGTIEPVAAQVGLSPFFVGLIIIPIVGNAAEHTAAITMAAKNQVDTALAITAGSSIQVALLAAPLLVLVSPLLGHQLTLDFSIFEVTIFGLVAGLFAIISLDGESTWLEGVLLLGFYIILAAGAFIVPVA